MSYKIQKIIYTCSDIPGSSLCWIKQPYIKPFPTPMLLQKNLCSSEQFLNSCWSNLIFSACISERRSIWLWQFFWSCNKLCCKQESVLPPIDSCIKKNNYLISQTKTTNNMLLLSVNKTRNTSWMWSRPQWNLATSSLQFSINIKRTLSFTNVRNLKRSTCFVHSGELEISFILSKRQFKKWVLCSSKHFS